MVQNYKKFADYVQKKKEKYSPHEEKIHFSIENEIKMAMSVPVTEPRTCFFSKSISVFRLFFVILQPEREITKNYGKRIDKN